MRCLKDRIDLQLVVIVVIDVIAAASVSLPKLLSIASSLVGSKCWAHVCEIAAASVSLPMLLSRGLEPSK